VLRLLRGGSDQSPTFVTIAVTVLLGNAEDEERLTRANRGLDNQDWRYVEHLEAEAVLIRPGEVHFCAHRVKGP